MYSMQIKFIPKMYIIEQKLNILILTSGLDINMILAL